MMSPSDEKEEEVVDFESFHAAVAYTGGVLASLFFFLLMWIFPHVPQTDETSLPLCHGALQLLVLASSTVVNAGRLHYRERIGGTQYIEKYAFFELVACMLIFLSGTRLAYSEISGVSGLHGALLFTYQQWMKNKQKKAFELFYWYWTSLTVEVAWLYLCQRDNVMWFILVWAAVGNGVITAVIVKNTWTKPAPVEHCNA